MSKTSAKIVNACCKEIKKNSEPRTSSVFNYKAYETDTTLFNTDVLDKIQSYDNDLEFVEKMNRILRAQDEAAGGVIEVSDSPGKTLAAAEDAVIMSEMLSAESDVIETAIESPEDPLKVECDKPEVSVVEENKQKQIVPLNEWEDDITNSSAGFVSFSPIREEESLPEKVPQSEFTIVSVESLAPENSEVDRRIEALVSLYKKKMKLKTRELDLHFQPFQNDATSHPSFLEQWKVFYLKQNFAIVSSGASDYDYKPAWNVFWSRYLQEQKTQELKAYESSVRNQLKIPDDVSFTTKHDFHDLSDISDEELDFQSPMKRPRMESEYPVKVFSDHDRMLVAYQLAYEHFKEDKQLTTDELSSLVSEYCSQHSTETISRSQSSSSQHLTDNDILNLYKKFNNLSPNEQANLISFVNSFKITDQKRYLTLSYKLKMQQNNWWNDSQLMKTIRSDRAEKAMWWRKRRLCE